MALYYVMMKILKPCFWLLLTVLTLVSCADDDSFSLSQASRLTFSTDTLKLDTVFSNVPGAMRSMWVYNYSGDGIRCKSVRLARGSRSGFRVNIDGIYLSDRMNYTTTEVSLRNRDSLRVMVELTAPLNSQTGPQADDDELIFTLESGVEQKVALRAWSWDAMLLRNVRVSHDSLISLSSKPLVIYGGITVDSAATLTIAAGTTLYFHADAGLNVHGRLLCQGTSAQNITLRGDRIDRMFGYLPYDRVPAQWKGLRFYTSSYGNELNYTDVHSTQDGIVVDSSDVSRLKLTLANSIVHNCQGYGLKADNAQLKLTNTLITNTLHDCLHLNGGRAIVNNCTLAQFYPFDSNRGAAIAFTARYPLLSLDVRNTIITGYADDQLMGTPGDTAIPFNYSFDHCVIRTPKVATADSIHFTNVLYEDVKDTVSMGLKHFVKIDSNNQYYDFRLSDKSAAIDKADPLTSASADRSGLPRDNKPDIGAFEYRP